jgi:ATP-dependent DNA helicase DinG
MNVTIYVPAHVGTATEARKILAEAIAKNAAPLWEQPVAGRKRLPLSLPTSLSSPLSALAARKGVQIGAYAEALIWGAVESSRSAPAAKPSTTSKLRIRLAEAITHCRKNKMFGLIEGSTGIGKSRIIAQAALDAIRDGADTVLVAAPTIGNLEHLVSEWGKVQQEDRERIAPVVILGRRQFVDDSSLLQALSVEAPEPDMEEAWNQAKEWAELQAAGGSLPSGKRLGNPALRWLADDLREAAPAFPVEDFLLDDTCEGSAAGIYASLREQAFESPVVFMSHAFLCQGALSVFRKQNPILPECELLLVDEAHSLEATMASALSSDLALSRLRVLVKGLPKSGDIADQITRLMIAIASACGGEDASLLFGRDLPPAWEACLLRAEGLAKRITTLAKKGGLSEKLVAELRDYADALKRLVSRKESVWVRFSPVLKYPTVSIGPASIGLQLAALWGMCVSAALLSATLYLPTRGGWSARFMRMKLALPQERFYQCDPVIAPWITSIPTLHLLSPELAPAFHYPSADDVAYDDLLPVWHTTIAGFLQATVCAQAVGGTLVLLRSFLDVREIGSMLTLALGDRLVCQHKGRPLQLAIEQFRARHKEGKRPVLLAVGGAWTGLDLKDHDAAGPLEDTLLTDLVVARLPYKSNTSPPAIHRESYMPDADILETALLLKQGFGRLIRREGVKDRHVWFLDRRPIRYRNRSIQLLLATYEKQELIH